LCHIAPVIQEFPEQWEAWIYLHKVANIVSFFDTSQRDNTATTVNEETNLMMNLKEYGVFKVLDDFDLFKKSGYTSFVIDRDVYGLLHCAISKPVRKKRIDDALFAQLFDNNVFVNLQRLIC